MRAPVRTLILAAVLIGAGALSGLAQDATTTAPATSDFKSPILTLKQEALFENSAFGKASVARLAAATEALKAENRQIELALEEEERSLTARRETMLPADFRPLATAFDAKVEGIRSAQDSKSRDLSRQLDADRQRLFEQAVPILAELMRDYGAVALLDQSAVILSLDRIDITDQVVERLDANLSPDPAPQDSTPPGNP